MEDDTFFFGLFLWEDLGAAAVVRAAAGALVGVGLGLGLVVGHGPGRGPFRAKAGPEVLCLVGNRKKNYNGVLCSAVFLFGDLGSLLVLMREWVYCSMLV